MPLQYDVVMESDESVREEIHEILRNYNRKHFGDVEEREFSITVRDGEHGSEHDGEHGSEHGENTVVAGLNATIFGLWLEISVLAVDENHRAQGIGSALLARAEQTGVEHGCRYALLNTFDFQGRDYYPKFGYRQIGHIENYPLTGSQHWFVKELGTDAH